MELSAALELVRTRTRSVLTTVRRDGRPQLSNVLYHLGDDDVLRVSTTAGTAKYHNLLREPWAAFHVSREDFFAYVVLEGEVELAPVAVHPDDATVDELVDLYRSLAGEHDDWEAYRAAMVAEKRTVVRFTPIRAYGLL